MPCLCCSNLRVCVCKDPIPDADLPINSPNNLAQNVEAVTQLEAVGRVTLPRYATLTISGAVSGSLGICLQGPSSALLNGSYSLSQSEVFVNPATGIISPACAFGYSGQAVVDGIAAGVSFLFSSLGSVSEPRVRFTFENGCVLEAQFYLANAAGAIPAALAMNRICAREALVFQSFTNSYEAVFQVNDLP